MANSLAIDSGDRIVAAGSSTDLPGTAFALARYEPNGDLDPSFGSGGTMTTGFGGEGIAYSVAIDSQGRIVAAGGTTEANGEFALARYEPNGGLDPSFGSDGKVTTHFRSEGIAHSVAIDSRDRIVAAGARCIDYPDCDFAIARYKPNGSLDRSFSRNGKVTKPKTAPTRWRSTPGPDRRRRLPQGPFPGRPLRRVPPTVTAAPILRPWHWARYLRRRPASSRSGSTPSGEAFPFWSIATRSNGS